MGRALWIAFTAIFTSLLLYLAFVGHREQVERVASNMPDVLESWVNLVERISLPNKNSVMSEKPAVKSQQVADTKETQNSEERAPNATQDQPVPTSTAIPAKPSPRLSKLAELARSQSVKRDVIPLDDVLPKLMIGDGPLLATPKTPPIKTYTPDFNVTSRPAKPATKKPQFMPQSFQAALVEPRPQAIKKSPKNNTIPTLPKSPEAKKSTQVAGIKAGLKKPAENISAVSKPGKKKPYTGNRKVTVAAGKGLVVVQPGNTLWDLAISIYGSSRFYQKLYRANQRNIKNPQMIFPGQIIFAPDANPPTSIDPISPPQWTPPQ